MSLVSVIIPYYRKKKFIKKTILSVLNQTYRKFEIKLIYDDIDLSDLSYLKEITKIDKRISLIVNKTNMGAGYSRNVGIKKSKGEFFAFIDADDIWNRNKLKLQLNFMKQNSFKFTHTSYNIVNDQNKIIKSRIARNFFKVKELLQSCDIGLSTVMIKKTLLNQNLLFSNIKTKEDFILWLKILEKKIPLIALKNKLTNWKKTKNSLSSNVIQKIIDGYKVYNHHMKFNFFKSIYYLLILSVNYLLK